MIVAIVPAAGKSERMGQPKLLLPLGPRRVIEHVLRALAASQVETTVVVVPPDATELACVVAACNADVVQLAAPTPDMRASIVAGLDRAEQLWGRDRLDAFLIALADQPTLSPATVDHLLMRFRSSSRSVFIPTHNGRRGHPVVFAWKHAQRVRTLPPDRGLNHLCAELGAEVEECPLNASLPLEDMDSPGDYERLRQRECWE